MKSYLKSDPLFIIQEGFNTNDQLASNRIFSIGNGHIKQNGNFEEFFSGKSVLGSYIKGTEISEGATSTEYKINSPNWTGIIVRLNEEILDLDTWDTENFQRTLNMHDGLLERTFNATSPKGYTIQVYVKRFVSMAEKEIGAISYSIKSINFEGRISFMPIIDGEIKEEQIADYESLWNVLQTKTQQDVAHLWNQIKLKDFHVCSALSYVLYKNNEQVKLNPTKIEKEKIAGFSVGTDVRSGDTICLNKYVAIVSSLNYPRQELTEKACNLALKVKQKGWNQLFEEHAAVWAEKWLNNTILNVDDKEKQQEIYFREFQNLQNSIVKKEI
ncbi:MAG: hypothetical protein WCJ61_02655 [Paludibacter sp.]